MLSGTVPWAGVKEGWTNGNTPFKGVLGAWASNNTGVVILVNKCPVPVGHDGALANGASVRCVKARRIRDLGCDGRLATRDGCRRRESPLGRNCG